MMLSGFFRRFPLYVWVSLAFALAMQFSAFYATRLWIDESMLHHLETPWDRMIPLRPHWIIIYFLSFVQWLVMCLWIISDNKTLGYRFTASYTLALMVSAAIFLIYPGTLTRPEIIGDDFFSRWMRFLYAADSPTNLCPSLHVTLTYFCMRFGFEARTIPPGLKYFNVLFLILVSLSILFVKQHVLIDIPAALVISEASFQTGTRFRIERVGFAIENKLKTRKEPSSYDRSA